MGSWQDLRDSQRYRLGGSWAGAVWAHLAPVEHPYHSSRTDKKQVRMTPGTVHYHTQQDGVSKASLQGISHHCPWLPNKASHGCI